MALGFGAYDCNILETYISFSTLGELLLGGGAAGANCGLSAESRPDWAPLDDVFELWCELAGL